MLIYTSDNQPPIHVVHTPRPHVAKTNYKRSAPESQSSSDPVQPLVFPPSFKTAGTNVRPIESLYASSYDGLAIPYGPRAIPYGPREQNRAAVNLPDGRVQTVTYYTANHYGGFVADVKYEGEAQYPPEKEYKPAPMYVPALS